MTDKKGAPRCKECGYRIRGPKHVEGYHHRDGRIGKPNYSRLRSKNP